MRQKLCVLLPSLEVGGVELIWSELVKTLELYEVTLFVLSERIDPSLEDKISSRFCIVRTKILRRNFFATYLLSHIDLCAFDMIHCVDRFTLAVSAFAKKRSSVVVTMGVYHSREMLWRHSSYFSKYQEILFRSLPSENIYFGNDYVCVNYSSKFKHDVPRSSIFVAGVSLLRPLERSSDLKFHIGIVGRHTSFKSYIEAALKTWQSDNFSVSTPLKVTLIGEGPLTGKFKRAFPDADFRGTFSIHELEDILPEFDFVLCGGTSVPLIASTGTPVLVGMENQTTPRVSGFFHEIAHDDYNLALGSNKGMQLREKISLFYSGDYNIKEMSAASIACSERFSFEIFSKKFSIFLGSAKPSQPEVSRIEKLLYRLSLVYWLILDVIGFNKSIRDRYKKMTDKKVCSSGEKS